MFYWFSDSPTFHRNFTSHQQKTANVCCQQNPDLFINLDKNICNISKISSNLLFWQTYVNAFKRGMEVERKKKVPFRYVNTGDCCYVAQNSKVFSRLCVQFFLQCWNVSFQESVFWNTKQIHVCTTRSLFSYVSAFKKLDT